jgi:hypothetical protein
MVTGRGPRLVTVTRTAAGALEPITVGPAAMSTLSCANGSVAARQFCRAATDRRSATATSRRERTHISTLQDNSSRAIDQERRVAWSRPARSEWRQERALRRRPIEVRKQTHWWIRGAVESVIHFYEVKRKSGGGAIDRFRL